MYKSKKSDQKVLIDTDELIRLIEKSVKLDLTKKLYEDTKNFVFFDILPVVLDIQKKVDDDDTF